MNSINLIGRLTKDPELRYTSSNVPVCVFTLAVKRPRVKDVTDFIDCVVWRQGAEFLTKYAGKGDTVGVSGNINVRKYEAKDGTKRTVYEVHAENVELIQGKNRPYQLDTSLAESECFQEIDEEETGELPF